MGPRVSADGGVGIPHPNGGVGWGVGGGGVQYSLFSEYRWS